MERAIADAATDADAGRLLDGVGYVVVDVARVVPRVGSFARTGRRPGARAREGLPKAWCWRQAGRDPWGVLGTVLGPRGSVILGESLARSLGHMEA
eukprot:363664-Chlamydomonas_euryale.AAC.4